MKTRNLLLIIVFCMLSCWSYSQESSDRYIIVFFTEGITREARTIDGETLQSAKFEDEKLRHTLTAIGIVDSLIEVALPEFSKADTLTILSDGQKLYQPDMTKLFRIKVPEGKSSQDVIDQLNKLPEVLYAEPDGILVPQVIPNDVYFDDQWGLRNTTNPGMDIHATAAWDIYTGNANNIIAIIDGGVEAAHPDITGKISGGSTGFGWGGHGTHVAGIAAARTNNVTGIAGVDWHARIHPQRVDNATIPQAYQRIVNAVNHSSNVHVLNHSYSAMADAFDNPLPFSATLRLAFAYAYKANRVSVASIGNYHETHPDAIYYPGGFDNVITVGATDIDDFIADFSNRGNHIDVSAPGVDIISTINGYYGDDSGTSMAAPHVSGIASLLKGYRPTLANDDIANIIRLSADKVDDMDGQNFTPAYGYGRVNACRALSLIREPHLLQQWTTSGGTSVSTTGYFPADIIGVPGILDGTYNVMRYEVRKTITFPQSFSHVKGAWGRGVSTIGTRPAPPLFGEGFCEVVPGTLTSTGATLRTYVYFVRTLGGIDVGYYPTAPANVSYAYTVVGIPSSVISGPSLVCNSNSTFSLGSLPPGSSVIWTRSGNLTYVSGQSSANFTVRAASPGTSGTGWVQVSIISACENVDIRKDVWVGPPSYDYISGPSYTPNNQWAFYSAEPNNPLMGAQYLHTWILNPLNGNALYPAGRTVDIAFYNSGDYQLLVQGQNGCGTGPYRATGIHVYDSKSLTITPNPATNEATITIVSTSAEKTLDETNEWDLEVYNSQQMLVKKMTRIRSNEYRLQTTGWRTGTYIVRVIYGNEVLNDKLLIVGH